MSQSITFEDLTTEIRLRLYLIDHMHSSNVLFVSSHFACLLPSSLCCFSNCKYYIYFQNFIKSDCVLTMIGNQQKWQLKNLSHHLLSSTFNSASGMPAPIPPLPLMLKPPPTTFLCKTLYLSHLLSVFSFPVVRRQLRKQNFLYLYLELAQPLR